MFLRKSVEPWRIDEIEANNSTHESNSHQGSKTLPIGPAGKTNHGIAAVLRGIKGKKKHKHTHPPASKIEVAHGVFLSCQTSRQPNTDEGKKIETHKDNAAGIQERC